VTNAQTELHARSWQASPARAQREPAACLPSCWRGRRPFSTTARSCGKTSSAALPTSRCSRARASFRSTTRARCATRFAGSTSRPARGRARAARRRRRRAHGRGGRSSQAGRGGRRPTAYRSLAQRPGRARPAAARARSGGGAAAGVATLIATLADRASVEKDVLLPAYTHRQRAQPVSAAFLVASWAVGVSRAADLVTVTLDRLEMPLGSGACSGTSLPIDRALVARLFAPWEPTRNALHTVGDRDFASTGRGRLRASCSRSVAWRRDVIDFADERVRADPPGRGNRGRLEHDAAEKKPRRAGARPRQERSRDRGNVVALLTLMKGLASGYNRDQQEDRLPLLEAGPLARGCARVVSLALPASPVRRRPRAGGAPRRLHPGDGLGRGACPTRGTVPRSLQGGRGLVAIAVNEGGGLRAIDATRARQGSILHSMRNCFAP